MVNASGFAANQKLKTTLLSPIQYLTKGTHCLSLYYYINSNNSNPITVRGVFYPSRGKNYYKEVSVCVCVYLYFWVV